LISPEINIRTNPRRRVSNSIFRVLKEAASYGNCNVNLGLFGLPNMGAFGLEIEKPDIAIVIGNRVARL